MSFNMKMQLHQQRHSTSLAQRTHSREMSHDSNRGKGSTACRITCDVRSPEEELRLVVSEERRMSTTLFLCEGIDLTLELLVGCHAARFAHYLTTHYIISLNAPQQQTNIVACLPLAQRLLEHLHTCTRPTLALALTQLTAKSPASRMPQNGLLQLSHASLYARAGQDCLSQVGIPG